MIWKPTELDALQKIAAGGYKQVVAVSCLQDAAIYFDTLKLAASQIIFIYRQPVNAYHFFTLDYSQAADAICQQIATSRSQLVGIFSDDHGDLEHATFVSELQNNLKQQAPNKKFIIIRASNDESYKAAFDFFSEEQIPDLFVAEDIEKASFLTQASFFW
ncbi:Uncharacterised protein [Providencia rettgeri]|uniref:Uncharacterized protein n=1 Tax=Providencia rettgeri TaxID=587 RepID=A0A379FNU5_PRORE|nr:Uncharacterised protein [Providencia rettgeri]